MGAPFDTPPDSPPPAPIARVAGDAVQAAALAELAGALARARAEGRLIEALPLGAIVADHLIRDRVTGVGPGVGPGPDEAAMAALVESLRARGQQVPIEVVALGAGRYGLISGWRRVQALRRLSAETGASAFATVRAILRAPRDAAEAYVAMVEENEIRLDLSHYERARIVARSVAGGVFPDAQTALRALFAHGSRARRSKIGSFLGVVEALDGVLRHPAQIGERLGLRLAQRLAAAPELGPRLRAALTAAVPADAATEAAVIAAVLGQGARGRKPPVTLPATLPATLVEEPVPGLRLETGGGWLHPVLTLSGPAVDQAFRDRLVAWLRETAAS